MLFLCDSQSGSETRCTAVRVRLERVKKREPGQPTTWAIPSSRKTHSKCVISLNRRLWAPKSPYYRWQSGFAKRLQFFEHLIANPVYDNSFADHKGHWMAKANLARVRKHQTKKRPLVSRVVRRCCRNRGCLAKEEDISCPSICCDRSKIWSPILTIHLQTATRLCGKPWQGNSR